MYSEKPANYDKIPIIPIQQNSDGCLAEWSIITEQLDREISKLSKKKKVLVIDCYQGVDISEVLQNINSSIIPDMEIKTNDLMKSEKEILTLTEKDVTDDRIFGIMSRLNLMDWFNSEKLNAAAAAIESSSEGIIVITGPGASIVYPDAEILVLADMPRWEIQQRMRQGVLDNLGLKNHNDSTESQYKRSYFVDWRVLDKHKKPLLKQCSYYLDTTIPGKPVLVPGNLIRKGYEKVVTRPFRMVPFFDPGPWGGQWMKEVCDLDKESPNYAWCFDCVMEEQSVLMGFGDIVIELPANNLVYSNPASLLGDPVHGRFGDEFPIRFDFLDTMNGGNLSLQVHPLTEYAYENFGISYTQDESYYILDAEDDATVYLGLKNDISPENMINDLKEAQKGDKTFDAEKYVQSWPAKKHDHFLIPAGTVHCSGKNSMVLEISATPYIFTFKLWDWGRLGMDGRPRPINIERGEKNIQWYRDRDWTERNLVNRFEELKNDGPIKEERTGLHEREFIETRRYWFSGTTEHNTGGVNRGSCHVANLIEGREAIVESPDGKFDPYVIHYAETFVIPADAGKYTIKPYGESAGEKCAVIIAWVRTGL